MGDKKSIIIINQDSGYLMIDLANAYNRAGYNVTLVTGRLRQRNKPLANDIHIKRIIRYNRTSNIKRLFTWSWSFLQILFYIVFKGRNKHLIIVSNPPFAPLLALFLKNPFSLLIYDIYPNKFAKFNTSSIYSIFIKWWRKANSVVFVKANRIITITPGMKNVLKTYSGTKEVEVIPIWTDNTLLRPIKKEKNKFVIRHNLAEKFVILYSGNLSYFQEVEVLVDLAAKIKDKDIQVIIIGDGDKKKSLQKMIVDLKLSNCSLLPFQPAKDLPFSLASADIAVVTLGKDASKFQVPSKTYDLMSVGVPILCIAEENSELSNLVERYQIGQNFLANQLEAMCRFIMEVKESPQKQKLYSSNALKASKDFGLENINKFITNHVH